MITQNKKIILLTRDGVMISLPSFSVFLFWIVLELCFRPGKNKIDSCLSNPDLLSLQGGCPVRETVSQTLASLLIHMPRRSVTHVHSILLQMIQQDFIAVPKSNQSKENKEKAMYGKFATQASSVSSTKLLSGRTSLKQIASKEKMMTWVTLVRKCSKVSLTLLFLGTLPRHLLVLIHSSNMRLG